MKRNGCPFLIALVPLLGAPWIAGAPTPLTAGGFDAPALTADAPPASRLATTWRSETARAALAPPGRASLLASPFGPVPAAGAPHAGVASTLSLAEAQATDEALDGDVVWASVACCGIDDIEQARAVVHGVMAAKNLPADAPVFIEAASVALAMALAERLGRDGLTQPVVVVRDSSASGSP
jgi:hypothetical protein